jgi:hypothetical protein
MQVAGTRTVTRRHAWISGEPPAEGAAAGLVVLDGAVIPGVAGMTISGETIRR